MVTPSQVTNSAPVMWRPVRACPQPGTSIERQSAPVGLTLRVVSRAAGPGDAERVSRDWAASPEKDASTRAVAMHFVRPNLGCVPEATAYPSVDGHGGRRLARADP